MKKYPFKFLDAYNQNDTDIFFGRDEEIKALYEMAFQHSILLVYGASGTGKTSLIQCGLAGRFKSYDWQALTIRRGSNLNESFEKMLVDAGGNNSDDEMLLPGERKLTGLSKMIRCVYVTHFKPLYLIFDQFEELYILGNKQEQEIFIASIKEILKSEQPVKLIFSIREEYLGHLYEFEKAVPQLLRKKLRVEPMTIDKVNDVLTGINQFKHSNVHIKDDELQTITEGIFNRLKGNKKTLTIQLPYLQVFLDKLYLEITKDETRQADAIITNKTILGMGDIGDVLRDFLESQVKSICEKQQSAGNDISTDEIWKMLSPFSTLEGTKDPIQKSELQTRLKNIDKTFIDSCVEEFVTRRILNYLENTNRYELAHDSLAKCIAEKRTDEDIALLEIRRLINNQVNIKADAREPFTERQLNIIEPHLAKLNLSDEEDKLIKESEKEVLKQKNKETRSFQLKIAALAIALVIMIGLTVWALIARQKADMAMKIAHIEKQRSDQALSDLKNTIDAKAKIDASLQIAIRAKQKTEFDQLKSRAEKIINANICPRDILNQMTVIADNHPDSILMKSIITTIENKCP